MANVLTEEKKQQVLALGRLGWSLRQIQRATRIRRETASAYLKAAGIAVRSPGGWGRRAAKPANEVITDVPPHDGKILLRGDPDFGAEKAATSVRSWSKRAVEKTAVKPPWKTPRPWPPALPTFPPLRRRRNQLQNRPSRVSPESICNCAPEVICGATASCRLRFWRRRLTFLTSTPSAALVRANRCPVRGYLG